MIPTYKTDEYIILHYALKWFEAHDDQHPICTCGSPDPSTLCTATHDVGCPVHAFTRRGWEYGVDRYQELKADGD